MTVTTYTLAPQGPTDLLGRRVAARLSEGTQQLPHEVSERLRAARVRAVARRKLEVVAPLRGYALAGAGRRDRAHAAARAACRRGCLVVIRGCPWRGDGRHDDRRGACARRGR